jgi:hypothetical protein
MSPAYIRAEWVHAWEITAQEFDEAWSAAGDG